MSDPCFPFSVPLEDAVLNEIVSKAKDWALMHGAGMRSKADFSADSLVFAPFTIFPSVVPAKEFNSAVEAQPAMNLLFHRLAHDHEFLSSALKKTIELDPFTRKLFEIYEKVRERGSAQSVSLGLLRSDYLLDCCCCNGCSSTLYHCCPSPDPPMDSKELMELMGSSVFRQVEMNTVASSFGAISNVVSRLHRFILRELGYTEDQLRNLPANNALSGLCQGIVDAWKYFNDPQSVVLFVVEDITYNICDQRFMEFEVRRLSPETKVIRRSLTELAQQSRLSNDNKLILDGKETVGVVYYRAGYDPQHYKNGEQEWEARLNIELSSAIKCPSIQYHLAGTKKVQQVLSEPGVVEKFLEDPAQAKAVRKMFTNIYPLDYSVEGNKAAEMGVKECERFVLKPQREGGGNNVYGKEIPGALEALGAARAAWILMQRIRPPQQSNYIVRPNSSNGGLPQRVNVVSELGVFGVIIGDENKVIMNKAVGHMLRTKTSDADEGGVAAGLGALDSPYLI